MGIFSFWRKMLFSASDAPRVEVSKDLRLYCTDLRDMCKYAASQDTAHVSMRHLYKPGSLIGHCGCVALAVQHRLGGDIVGCTVVGFAHLWNRLADGTEIDLTSEQFGGDGFTPVLEPGKAIVSLDKPAESARVQRFLFRLQLVEQGVIPLGGEYEVEASSFTSLPKGVYEVDDPSTLP